MLIVNLYLDPVDLEISGWWCRVAFECKTFVGNNLPLKRGTHINTCTHFNGQVRRRCG